jgi:hypothetical protein
MIGGSRFQSFVIRIALLAACGLQGIVPDAKDAVSFRGLYVLCQLPVPLEIFGNDSDEDEAAVLTPTSHQFKLDVREIIDSLSRFGFASSSPLISQSSARRSRAETIERLALKHERLCLVYCRLVC